MQELELEDKRQSQSRSQGPELKQDRENSAGHTEIADHSDTIEATEINILKSVCSSWLSDVSNLVSVR